MLCLLFPFNLLFLRTIPFFTLHASITCIPPAPLFFGAHSSLFGSHFQPLLKLQQHSQSTSSHLFAQMRESLVAGSLLVALGHCIVPRENDSPRTSTSVVSIQSTNMLLGCAMECTDSIMREYFATDMTSICSNVAKQRVSIHHVSSPSQSGTKICRP